MHATRPAYREFGEEHQPEEKDKHAQSHGEANRALEENQGQRRYKTQRMWFIIFLDLEKETTHMIGSMEQKQHSTKLNTHLASLHDIHVDKNKEMLE